MAIHLLSMEGTAIDTIHSQRG